MAVHSDIVQPGRLLTRGRLIASRCVLAVLNSNLELSIWGAVKNHLRGEWVKVYVDGLSSFSAAAVQLTPDHSSKTSPLRSRLRQKTFLALNQ